MALFRPILGELAGSIANNTFSHNRFGAYVRNRTIPVNPSSPAQVTARGDFGTEAGAWKSLTAGQRTSWKAYADATPLPNKLGEPTIRTGAQMYVRTNSLRRAAGLAPLTDPPPTPGVAGVPIIDPADITVEDSTSTNPNQFSITVADITNFVPNLDGEALFFSFGFPVSAGVTFYKAPFRMMRPVLLGDSGTPPTTYTFTIPYAVPDSGKIPIAWRRLAATGTGIGKVSDQAFAIVTAVNV